ncbi:ABC transporter permease subunit [Oceanobacillus sp. 143]|uniref:Glutamine ABC transporter permease n=1 Tax=Oceanobacillus zhaokaii TaxID=2052660 RepID=A0A345PL39_9BACI|nr:amino acid ABC transporter permease [Oceanobacillus zhaokaii]AXI10719.1 glutamine ABC transporter permease [Oceanobacillus zhaokaii]QGS69653.1 ABC transporter permease subunit [Oceanobacillus sp. 143]
MDFVGAYSLDNLAFLMQGFYVTLKVAVIAIIFSFIIGGILGTIRFSKVPVISQIVVVIVETIRNLPLLLIILFTYLALPEIGINLSITVSAIIALVVFESSMIAEIVRGGLNSIEKGQMEAARSSGLTYLQALQKVILPQALRRMVPNLVSQFISLLKDTSLAVIISLPEMLHHAKIIQAQNIHYVIPIFILIAVIYFIVNYILSLIARRLELKHT